MSIDVIRVLREVFPLRRIINAKFKVIQSTHMRAVLGQDILNEQDYDMPCPLQSDIDYDEQKEVKNYLEAAMDRGILAGLSAKYAHKYRDLIFKECFRVFRLRLEKDSPAHGSFRANECENYTRRDVAKRIQHKSQRSRQRFPVFIGSFSS